MEGDYESFEPAVIPSVEQATAVTSSKTIACFAFGLLSVLLLPVAGLIALFLNLVALILGILGLVDIKRNPNELAGKGLAIASSVLSLVTIIAVVISFLVVSPSIEKIRKAVEKQAAKVHSGPMALNNH